MRKLILLSALIVFSQFSRGADIDREYSKTDQEIDGFYGSAAEERGAASQHAALVSYLKSIDKASEMPLKQSIPLLGGMLRKLCKKNIFQVPERLEVYDKAREALLSIPGHAEYFRDEILREQEEVKDLGMNVGKRVGYDRNRSSIILGTLPHLPSPETVQVLGGFLKDRRDIPKGRYPSYFRANDSYAAQALGKIGLRDSPQKEPFTDSYLDVNLWLDWWAEVEAGERAFSFKGQDVEYRFKPDGTWDTIPISNPPDDAGEALDTGTVQRPDKRLLPEAQPQRTEPKSKPWPWLGGSAVALIALLAWFFLRIRNA